MSGGVKFLPIRSYAISRLPGCAHDRVEIMVVGAASAEVAGQRVTHLVAGRFRIDLEKGNRRHDLAGSTEAALRRQLLDECFLHRMQLAVRAFEALDGGDLAAAQRVSERRA